MGRVLTESHPGDSWAGFALHNGEDKIDEEKAISPHNGINILVVPSRGLKSTWRHTWP